MDDREACIELRLLMSELRKWLTGDYGSLPGGVTMSTKPADLDYAVLRGLSEEGLVVRAKALLDDTHRVIDQVALAHPSETRLINNLIFYASTLSEALRGLEKAP